MILRESGILQKSRWLHPLLLLVWTGLGTVLRLTELTAKPFWTDEFATIVFSLGHSFRGIPLNQIISAATLLQPLQVNTIGSISDVVHHLITESTHPPIYFVLANGWMRLWLGSAELVSVEVARSLPALLGVLAIPAMFGLGWVAFRSVWMAQLAAALMAVSPFGIALAQEARHYTLAVLWVIASLACLAIALRHLQQRSVLPLWLMLAWIAVNSLGMATHYFFALTLCAEGMTLLGFWLSDRPGKPSNPAWKRIYWVAAGTLVGSLVWLPAWQTSYDSEITQWVYRKQEADFAWLNPLLYTLASTVTMLILLPVQEVPKPIFWLSGTALVALTVWLGWLLVRGLKFQLALPDRRWMILGSGGVVVAAIALLLFLDYGLGTDLTRGLRYNFVYFPAFLLLVAVVLTRDHPVPFTKSAIALILLGLLGSLTVTFNGAYQKVHRPDLVVRRMQDNSRHPVLVAIAHHTHGQTGRLMGLAWGLQSTQLTAEFYLDHQSCEITDQKSCDRPTQQLRQAIAQLTRPTDLWLINFQALADLSNEGCQFDKKLRTRRVDGYKYQHYRCKDSLI